MNAYTSVVRSYQQQAVNTGSPLRLVVFLYDGAIRFFRLSARAFAEGEREKAREFLLRAEKMSLNFWGHSTLKPGEKLPGISPSFTALSSAAVENLAKRIMRRLSKRTAGFLGGCGKPGYS